MKVDAEWTWNELERYAISVRGIKNSTWKKHLNYLIYLRDNFGVNIHVAPSVTYEQFLDYVRKIRGEYGDEGENRIKHAKDAVKLLFGFYGIANQYEWPTTKEIENVIMLPPEWVVYQHIHGKMHKDPFMSLQLNYICHLGYVLGSRPGAIPGMKIRGVDLERLSFTYYEPKVRSFRKTHLPEFAMTSRVDKSLKNWIEIHRPKVATRESGDYLWLSPDGAPLDTVNFLAMFRRRGKEVWEGWYPYLMRHYAFTRYLVEGYRKFGVFPIYELKLFTDHKKMRNVFKYVHLAEELTEHSQQRMEVGRFTKRYQKEPLKKRKVINPKTLTSHNLRNVIYPGGPI